MKAIRKPPCQPFHRIITVALTLLVWGCSGSHDTMFEAIRVGDAKRVRALLKADPAAVSHKDNEGQSPLHWAAAWGHTEFVKLLLDHHADVNSRNAKGKTPLHWAATSGQPAVAELLLANGADVHARANLGQTPLHSAVIVARQFEPDQRVAELLLSKGADINATDSRGWTALHWAAILNHRSFANFLLAKGATCDIFAASALGDIDRVKQMLKSDPGLARTTNASGLTPLHWASVAGREAVVELLLARGADVNAQDSQCRTALHETADQNEVKVAEILLSHHADVNARGRDGNTAIRCAALKGSSEMVALLSDYGAKE